jgi:hypothetical protein
VGSSIDIRLDAQWKLQISALLERQNSYSLDQQMTALQNIEKQAQAENAMMRQLAEKSSQDSTSVRILTIIMLIYLPCTVVSVRVCPSQTVRADIKAELLFHTVRQTER